MEIEDTSISDIKILHVPTFEDERGYFTEVYSRAEFSRCKIKTEFVQDAHSLSTLKYTLRGFHFQAPPHAQAKLVRVESGKLFDVAVDIRKNSPTFGHHVCVTLQAGDGRMIYIPEGFAHGFCTLAINTKIAYKLSAEYDPKGAGGIAWDDPALGICWPVAKDGYCSSKQDMNFPSLADMTFVFD